MTLSTLSWNIAAVNNNPFEYFLTHPDPKYISLMEGVEGFIEAPGERDVKVGSVFTQAMYDELAKRMEAEGWNVAPVAAVWSSDLSQRTIIGGFLKDKGLGAKRLMSMPDRFTNTIDLAGGGVANRPCITSNYDADMSTLPKWWAAWPYPNSHPNPHPNPNPDPHPHPHPHPNPHPHPDPSQVGGLVRLHVRDAARGRGQGRGQREQAAV